jgi:hypothetical protein
MAARGTCCGAALGSTFVTTPAAPTTPSTSRGPATSMLGFVAPGHKFYPVPFILLHSSLSKLYSLAPTATTTNRRTATTMLGFSRKSRQRLAESGCWPTSFRSWGVSEALMRPLRRDSALSSMNLSSVPSGSTWFHLVSSASGSDRARWLRPLCDFIVRPLAGGVDIAAHSHPPAKIFLRVFYRLPLQGQ